MTPNSGGAGAAGAGAAAQGPRSGLRTVVGGVVLPLAFVAALVWFVWHERERLEPLTEAPGGELALIGLLVVVSQVLSSMELWLLYRAQGAPAGPVESWFVFIAGQLANHLPAQAGTIYRLRYMNAVHDVPYGESVGVYGALLVATLGGAAVAGLAAVAGVSMVSHLPVAVGLLYGAMGVAALVMIFVPLPRLAARTGRPARAWRAARDGFDRLRSDPATAGAVVVVEAFRYVVLALRFQVAFDLIGIDESFWFFLGLAPAAGVAGFVAVTPGAVGFREAFVAAAAVGLGSGLDSSVLAATVDRAAMFAVTVVMGTIGLAATYPRLRRRRQAAELLVTSAGGDAGS